MDTKMIKAKKGEVIFKEGERQLWMPAVQLQRR